MNRLGRILFNGLTVPSLLLLVASVVAWVWSYWFSHGWRHNSVSIDPAVATMRDRVLAFEAGAVLIGDQRNQTTQPAQIALARQYPAAFNFPPPAGLSYVSYPDRTPLMPWRPLVTFDFQTSAFPQYNGTWTFSQRILAFPIWLPTLLFAVLPLLWYRRRRKHRRRIASNHCPVCGYDLRATTERCPECGTIPKP